jgi:hypothetical protein
MDFVSSSRPTEVEQQKAILQATACLELAEQFKSVMYKSPRQNTDLYPWIAMTSCILPGYFMQVMTPLMLRAGFLVFSNGSSIGSCTAEACIQ